MLEKIRILRILLNWQVLLELVIWQLLEPGRLLKNPCMWIFWCRKYSDREEEPNCLDSLLYVDYLTVKILHRLKGRLDYKKDFYRTSLRWVKRRPHSFSQSSLLSQVSVGKRRGRLKITLPAASWRTSSLNHADRSVYMECLLLPAFPHTPYHKIIYAWCYAYAPLDRAIASKGPLICPN